MPDNSYVHLSGTAVYQQLVNCWTTTRAQALASLALNMDVVLNTDAQLSFILAFTLEASHMAMQGPVFHVALPGPNCAHSPGNSTSETAR